MFKLLRCIKSRPRYGVRNIRHTIGGALSIGIVNRFVVGFCCIFISAISMAYEMRNYASIGGFEEEGGGGHSGIEISGFSEFSKYAALKFSGVLYSEDQESKYAEVYGGFSGTLYVHLDSQHVAPYLGVGLFVGDTFNCSDREEEEGSCEEDTVLAVYPELAVAINISRVKLMPFARRYFDTNEDAGDVTAYGLQVGFRF